MMILIFRFQGASYQVRVPTKNDEESARDEER